MKILSQQQVVAAKHTDMFTQQRNSKSLALKFGLEAGKSCFDLNTGFSINKITPTRLPVSVNDVRVRITHISHMELLP